MTLNNRMASHRVLKRQGLRTFISKGKGNVGPDAGQLASTSTSTTTDQPPVNTAGKMSVNNEPIKLPIFLLFFLQLDLLLHRRLQLQLLTHKPLPPIQLLSLL